MFEVKKRDNPYKFERLLFVCKAMSGNPQTPFTSVVHVERTRTGGSRFIATDGRRMHVTEIKERIAKGDYKPVITRDTITFGKPVDGIIFPNWKNIIPDSRVKKGTLNLEKTGMGGNPKTAENMTLAFHDFVKRTGTVASLQYLNDLPKRDWELSIHKGRKTVIMMSEKGTEEETYAVFVPLKEAA